MRVCQKKQLPIMSVALTGINSEESSIWQCNNQIFCFLPLLMSPSEAQLLMHSFKTNWDLSYFKTERRTRFTTDLQAIAEIQKPSEKQFRSVNSHCLLISSKKKILQFRRKIGAIWFQDTDRFISSQIPFSLCTTRHKCQ